MKRILHLFYSINIFLTICNAQSQPITERLGNRIDIHEKTYFNLFPKFNNFIEAEIKNISIDSAGFYIKYEDSGLVKDTTIYAGQAEIINLRLFLDNYERLSDYDYYKSLNLNMESIQPKFLNVYLNYSFYDDIELELVNSNIVRGKLLYFDNELIVIYEGQAYFDYKKIENVIVLYYQEIEYLSYRTGYFIKGSKELYLEILKILDSQTAFKNLDDKGLYYYPSELKSLIEQKKKEIANNIFIRNENVNFDESGKYHYSIYLNSSLNIVLDRSVYLIKPGIENEDSEMEKKRLNVNGLDLLLINFDFAYSLTQKIKLGTDLFLFPNVRNLENSINIAGGSGSLYLNYSIKPVEALLFSFIGRSEISATIGLTYNYIRTRTKLTQKLAGSFYGKIDHELINQSLGTTLRGKLDYYLFSFFSIGVQIDYRYMIPIEYPQYNFVVDQDYWNTYKKISYLGKDEINMSGSGIWLGCTYHQ